MNSAEKAPFETNTPALAELVAGRLRTLGLAYEILKTATGNIPAQPPTVEGQQEGGNVNQ